MASEAESPITQEDILREIKSYRCKPKDKVALERIAHSKIALEAITSMALTQGRLRAVLVSFVVSYQIKRGFRSILAKEVEFVSVRKPYLLKALLDLKGFLGELANEKTDPVRIISLLHEGEYPRLTRALSEVKRLVEQRAQQAEINPVWMGVTRKSSSGNAAATVAIGWLGASVMNITGRPWSRQTCKLAEVLLEIQIVSEARLRSAVKNLPKQQLAPFERLKGRK